MKQRRNILLITGLLAMLAAIILLAGCNPVKRVMRDPAKVEKVVVEWRKKHPLDTTKVVTIPGKDTTIIREVVKLDSIPLPYPVNHRYTEIRYKDRLVVDTIRVTMQDTAMIGLLLRKLDAMEKMIQQQDAKIKELRGFKTGVIFLAITALIVGVVAVIRKFKLI